MMVAGTGFQIADIDDVWPRIAQRAGRSRSDAAVLESACRRCHSGGDAVCLQGPDGILIVAAVGAAALVLLAVATQSAAPGAFRRQEAAMLDIARDLGAKRLEFQTDRRGWGRMLGPQWHLDGDTFSRSTA